MNNPELPTDLPHIPPKPVTRKVSERSPEYQLERKVIKSDAESSGEESFFGYGTLQRVNDIRRNSRPIDEQLSEIHKVMREASRRMITRRFISPPEAEAQIKEVLEASIEDFQRRLADRKSMSAAESILHEALSNREICRRIRQEGKALGLSNEDLAKYSVPPQDQTPDYKLVTALFGKSDLESSDFISLETLIERKQISGELWTLILENHGRQFKSRGKRFRETFEPGLVKVFRQRVQEAIAQGELPIQPALLEQRIAETTVILRDAIQTSFDHRSGSYHISNGLVEIDSSLSMVRRAKKLTHVYFHEMFHALSGRTIVGEESPFNDDEFTALDHTRSGIRFRNPQTKVIRFGWLDEALTERLTLRYTKQQGQRKDYPYYHEEELLAFLSTMGKEAIHERLFLDAYFENLDPDVPSDTRLPGWKALSTQMEKSWGPGFLNRLDQKVKELGPSGALKWLREQKNP